MYRNDDDDLGLGEHESAWVWPGDRILDAEHVSVRGDHILDTGDIGSGEYHPITPDDVAKAAEGLIAPRVYVEHDWGRPHPHDTSSPCEYSITVAGWRPMTDEERKQVEMCRNGEYHRRVRKERATREAEALEARAKQLRAAARRTR